MNRKRLFLGIVCALISGFVFADPAGDIAKAGDDAWNNLINEYKREGRWVDPVSADAVIDYFNRYKGKVMMFPGSDFSDFITDKDGNKYYCYGDMEGFELFVIKYHDGIQDQLYKLNNALGNYQGKYEVLGTIVDAWEWWGRIFLTATWRRRRQIGQRESPKTPHRFRKIWMPKWSQNGFYFTAPIKRTKKFGTNSARYRKTPFPLQEP